MDNDDVMLTIEQTGDFGGGKTINVNPGGSSSDVEAIVDLTYNIFQYIPELIFVSIYALVMYAAVLLLKNIWLVLLVFGAIGVVVVVLVQRGKKKADAEKSAAPAEAAPKEEAPTEPKQ